MYNQQNFGNENSGSSDFRNPKSILRNTVRIRPGEHAVLRFITDFADGDMSRFHGIPQMTAKGQPYTSYEYCSRLNLNESGPIITTECEHCTSGDEKISKSTSRYLAWVMHYGTYHVEQNPFLDRDGQEAWEQTKVGNRIFFREAVKKPQLLNTSYTLFKNIEDKWDRYSTLLGRTFDYISTRPSNITQYSLEVSDMTLQNDFSQAILDIEKDLPDLEQIAAKLIVEVDLVSVGSDTDEMAKEQVEDAFTNMANMKVEEL